MKYRLLARPEFVGRWFPEGFTVSAVEHAPAVMFTRNDMLHYKILRRVLGDAVTVRAIHYVPAIDQFTQMISSGYAYGMVPDWQSTALRTNGEVVEVHEKAHDSVNHYWHCWNIDSLPLRILSKRLVDKARLLLA